MAKLSWGRCLILYAESVNGAPKTPWSIIDTPKEDSTKLEPQAGNEFVATDENGNIIDTRTGAGSATLSFDLFVKRGEPVPMRGFDCIVDKEMALRVVPFDNTCEGVQIDRCRVTIQESYSTDEGKMIHYSAKVLQPAEGRKVKPYEYTQESLRLVNAVLKMRATGKTTFVNK